MPKIKMQTEFDVPDDVFEQSVEKAIKNNSDYVLVVRCKDCKHWHEETGWCTVHSHFVDTFGMACHPSQSSDWKSFDENYYCADAERRTDDA